MLRSINSLLGYAIRATDGDLGRVDDFYFDDQTWTIRYLVVETGNWLSGRKVLLSPVALHEADWASATFSVNLSREQVRDSPPTDTAKSVSRQHEAQLLGHYDWPMYWGSGLSNGGMYGATPVGPLVYEKPEVTAEEPAPDRPEDPHLRSMQSVAGYAVHARDGDLGHVEDYIIEDASWILRFLVVATSNWLAGRRVLISPHWIKSVEWGEGRVTVDLSREEIKDSPEFDSTEPVSADYEGKLHDYYGRPSAPNSPPEAQ
jgi:uncharacterized protein YrrD